MGNVLSSGLTRGRACEDVTSESETMEGQGIVENVDGNVEEEFHDSLDEDAARDKTKEDEMVEFKKELDVKRVQRKEILARHRAEKEELVQSLKGERKAKLETYETNRRLRDLLIKSNIEIPEELQPSKENSDLSDTITHMREEFEILKSNNTKLRLDLVQSNSALQSAYSDIADLSAQNIESLKQINALKEVVTVSKTMINLREQQLIQLKNKLSDIEKSLADRETSLLSSDLRQEYERQLQNIRTLRGLYEERARLAEVTRQSLVRDLEEQRRLHNNEVTKCKELTDKIKELEDTIDTLEDTIENKNQQISLCQNETRSVQADMLAVNKLFSQVLLGYKSKQDLDTLVHRLEEHHGLLTQMAEKENDSEASSALPKLLLEIVSQVDNKEDSKITQEENSSEKTESVEDNQNGLNGSTAEEIVQKLPKVWKVLIELLSHQTVDDAVLTDKITTCYKSVETNSGPVLVPSVSQTYIRLKDLIIEKLALIKEVNRMKQLNSHLGMRLEEQEKKLCLVSSELSKTWHVVGRLRRHHHQLHTHEKILKYELQQKRKLLNELKEDLEYCREKWEQAREKNTQSEKDWQKLRAEFSSRKAKSTEDTFNNSPESGYSDERPSDESSESNDESEYVTEPLVRCKKKIKKSVENILDSSTDFNLAAEREDPASDMIDVADLPLDTLEGDDSQDASASISCNSENLLKNDIVCEETEDEICDIANDLYVDDLSVTEHFPDSGGSYTLAPLSCDQNDDSLNSSIKSTPLTDSPVVENKAISKTVNEQNVSLVTKDKKLDKFEKNITLLSDTEQNLSKLSDALDHTENRPNRSDNSNVMLDQNERSIIGTCTGIKGSDPDKPTTVPCTEIHNGNAIKNNKELYDYNNEANNTTCNKTDTKHVSPEKEQYNRPTSSQNQKNVVENVDFRAILENIKRQDELLAKKDERLSKLEDGCSEVVKTISNTINMGDSLVAKIEFIHNQHDKINQESKHEGDLISVTNNYIETDEQQPSTSNDHEARFAARDLRLKRLEEQTKSLVNKVNNTKTKGVKINYKLQELHNIYGSENSRASTPDDSSEDRSDKSQNDDI